MDSMYVAFFFSARLFFFFYSDSRVQHFGDSPCNAAGLKEQRVRCVTSNSTARRVLSIKIELSAACLLGQGQQPRVHTAPLFFGSLVILIDAGTGC